ncbi:MAG: preprotein translocase subunit SecG [Candidatus Paceibacterota bacterium]|jgi:protein translocase SecG subunit
MILSVLQIIIAAAIVVLIILQERSAGLSGIFGGGDSGGFYHARRGMEKAIFTSTVVLTILFIGLAVFKLLSSSA